MLKYYLDELQLQKVNSYMVMILSPEPLLREQGAPHEGDIGVSERCFLTLISTIKDRRTVRLQGTTNQKITIYLNSFLSEKLIDKRIC
jgi:hypothetical protein